MFYNCCHIRYAGEPEDGAMLSRCRLRAGWWGAVFSWADGSLLCPAWEARHMADGYRRRRTVMGTAMAGKGKERGDHAMLAAARAYTRRGWRVVPVRPREKGVTLSGWQQLRLEEADLRRW